MHVEKTFSDYRVRVYIIFCSNGASEKSSLNHAFRFNFTGYENISCGEKTPSEVIEGLKKSPGHNSVMLNEDGRTKGGLDWSKQQWGSVGAALLHDGDNHLAPLWFAVEKDNSTC